MRFYELLNIDSKEKEQLKRLEENITKNKNEFINEYFIHNNLYEKFEDQNLENFISPYKKYNNSKYSLSIYFYITKKGSHLDINKNKEIDKNPFEGKQVCSLFFKDKKEIKNFLTQLKLKFSSSYILTINFDYDLLESSNLLRTDNPGGRWLQSQKDRAAKSLRFAEGSQTANFGISGPKIEIRVDYIKNLPGVNGEHKFRHGGSKYDDIMSSVKEEGWNPKYAIMIWVDYQGIAKIAEGNHRTAVAADLGIEWIPAEIHYYAGGEEVPGRFNPDTLESKGIIRIRQS